MDLCDLTFEINWAISNPFSRKRYWKRLFLFFINPKKMFAGHMWHAGQTLLRPASDSGSQTGGYDPFE